MALVELHSVSLVVTLSAATDGTSFIGNEITASGQFNANSTPGNNVATQDDQALTGFTVPVNLCAGRSTVRTNGSCRCRRLMRYHRYREY